MGCNCGKGVVPITELTYSPTSNDTLNQPCSYNFSNISDLYTKLNLVKLNNQASNIGITNIQLNGYLGILISALNYSNNYCYFAPSLDIISQLIPLINAL